MEHEKEFISTYTDDAKNRVVDIVSVWPAAYELSAEEIIARCAFITGAALGYQGKEEHVTKGRALEIIERYLDEGIALAAEKSRHYGDRA